ncbi:type II toxin-antitoxin system RelE/ParE family toxin [Undibacterium rugosum]|uniref:Type II toxin-antitoxin system RelE/ParE family toxin n=1 Tax=Undibacterium rugosum TaxID=2762291 RepID=A0A923KWE6_9BURK|nr:type II toxin-antitoxin system RelE/ParE family toxin [Undibacterium rugosum]MBC3936457.1 type II toxin-antitoxin system RelE/ParE family toxin [Undibacterium rugosum]MBR7779481.1 type II toxin-antitoxin system RelE/ParE family toxin [Undibacterium rugosum]
MSYKVQVLAYAKDDYREIRGYVKRKFGDQVWMTVESDFKKMLKQIAEMPLAGSVPEEIEAIGLVHYRQRLVGKTRIIYQIKEEEIFVHMFVDTNRDFPSVLYDRLMSR